jgi:hypothetical protein
VDVDAPETHATGEVASGGSSGDVEVGVDERPGRDRGSEATETWDPGEQRPTKVVPRPHLRRRRNARRQQQRARVGVDSGAR